MTMWPETDTELPAGRRERKRARRVNDILRMTAGVVSERGYHNASLEEVAERLDLAKASLYHYFDSKEALVYECLETCANYVGGRLAEIAAGDGTPTERLRALVECQVQTITTDYPEMARLFLYPLDWPDGIRQAIDAWRDEHDQIFRKVISEGVAAGELDADTATVARLLLHGALNDVPRWFRTKGRNTRTSTELVVDTAMRLFVAAPA